jgi:putative ABC transport system permease protein
MLAYQIRNAFRSMRRNPVLSALLIAAIGLGIGVSTAFITTYYLLAGDPIPEKSHQLFYVELDSWDPNRPYNDDHPDRPPEQITYRDMIALMENEIATYKSGMFKASLTVQPEADAEKPYREIVRMCFSDFFPMFEVPFEYGGGWGRSVDTDADPVVVIDGETNRRLFGGENSVGRKLRIENRDFTVVGVIADWRPRLKYYDPNNNPFSAPEAILMPFAMARQMEIYSAGNNSNWKYYDGDAYQDFLDSEQVWIQMWVQLDERRQRNEYTSFLDAYTEDQKSIGRFQRPTNNLLLPVMALMEQFDVVPDEARALLLISIMFLVVCSVNLIGILLGKFLSRAPEVGVRRALGASRRSVFLQHIVECEVIGLLGGVLGIGLSVVALELINGLFDGMFAFGLDANMILAGLLLSLVAGLIAGLYPSWRICRVAPAIYLKDQ